jgi:hypothetical protein
MFVLGRMPRCCFLVVALSIAIAECCFVAGQEYSAPRRSSPVIKCIDAKGTFVSSDMRVEIFVAARNNKNLLNATITFKAANGQVLAVLKANAGKLVDATRDKTTLFLVDVEVKTNGLNGWLDEFMIEIRH